jgi:outer membrane lipoprotein-sorting protein
MNPLLRLSRRARWAVPGGVLAVTAAITAGSMITVAQASPELPARSPAQLLAAAAGHTGVPPALTGTVVETASLGIPDLPGTGNPTSITSLLAGSHTIKVWYADPTHVRLAVPVSLSETDLIRNGSTVWLWDSKSNTVTRMQVPAKAAQAQQAVPAPTQAPLTPQQAAQQVLAAVGPTTTVSVDPAATVADQAAYQLVLAPKSSSSLIGKVTIALDGQHMDVPLRVQVFARGATTPAFQVGYTSVAFVRPAAANFDFTPPPGATVTNGAAGIAGGLTGFSPDRSAVMRLKVRSVNGQQVKVVNGQPVKVVMVKGKPVKILVNGRPVPGQPVQVPLVKGQIAQAAAGAPKVIGKDWLSVAVFPANGLSGISGMGNAAALGGQAAQSVAGGPAGGPGPGNDNAAILGALLQAATPVHGAWGSGKLLTTSLLSVLIMDNGKVLVGSVTPAVLYSAAAQVK